MNDEGTDEVVDTTDMEAIDAAAQEQARRHYEDLFEMYAMPGWKHVMTEIQSQIVELQDIRRATKDNIDTAKGALMVLDILFKHEEMNRRAYDMVFAPAQVH